MSKSILKKDTINKIFLSILLISILFLLTLTTLVIGFNTEGELKYYIFIYGCISIIFLFILYNVYKFIIERVIDIRFDFWSYSLILFFSYRYFSSYLHKCQVLNNFDLLIGISIVCVYLSLRNIRIKNEKFIFYIAFTYFLIAIVESCIGTYQYFFWDENINYKTVVVGTVLNPNYLGLLIIIGFGSGCHLLHYCHNKLSISFIYLGLLLLVWGCFITESKGAFFTGVASGAIVCLYCIFCQFKLSVSLTTIVSILIGLSILFCYLLIIDPHSALGRWMKIQIAISIIKDHIIVGVGEGNYMHYYIDYQYIFLQINDHLLQYWRNINESTTVNNQYIKYAVELGLTGLVLFLFIILYWFKSLFQNSSVQSFKYVLFFISCIAIHMFFEETLSMPIFLMPFILLMYVFTSKKVKHRKNKTSPILVLIVLIGGCILLFRYMPQYSSRKLFYEGKAALLRGEFSNAIFYCRQSLLMQPEEDTEVLLARSLIGDTSPKKDSRIREGIKILEKIRYIHQSRDLYLALAYGYYRLGKYDAAANYALLCHKLFPTQIRPLFLLYITQVTLSKKELTDKITYLSCHIRNKTKDVEYIIHFIKSHMDYREMSNVEKYKLSLIFLSH